MAVGDQLNDLEMIEAVGLGVAMGNAVPLVKERARAVVATNDQMVWPRRCTSSCSMTHSPEAGTW